MEIRRVGVAGCGLMGSGIAEIAAKAGLDVVVREIDEGALAAGRGRVVKSLERAVAKGKLDPAARDEVLSRVTFTTSLDDLADRDLVIEAIVESLDAKNELFGYLDGVCPEETIFASNTSSLTVTDMAAATSRPDRFVGLHFFNPVPVMKLVEVVRTIVTSQETFDAARAFSRRVGKVPISARDNSGFVVNLLLVPYMLDAIRQLERGVATVEDIDTAMRLGLNYPYGPLELADRLGPTRVLTILAHLQQITGDDRYRPSQWLRRRALLGLSCRSAG